MKEERKKTRAKPITIGVDDKKFSLTLGKDSNEKENEVRTQ